MSKPLHAARANQGHLSAYGLALPYSAYGLATHPYF